MGPPSQNTRMFCLKKKPNFQRRMPPLPKTNSKRHMNNGENGGYQFRLLQYIYSGSF